MDKPYLVDETSRHPPFSDRSYLNLTPGYGHSDNVAEKV